MAAAAVVKTHATCNEETRSTSDSSVSIDSSVTEDGNTYNGIGIDSSRAWLVVLASFGVQFISGGVFFCFGLFLLEISDEFHDVGKDGVAWIASIMIATQHIVGPVVSILAKTCGYRNVSLLGAAAVSLGYGLSFFARDVVTLYLTLGVVSGIGFGLIYLPSMVIVPLYFDKRRALAVGVAVCGSGLGVLAFERVYDLMLGKISWRTSFAITSGIILTTGLFSLLYGGSTKSVNADADNNKDPKLPKQKTACLTGLFDFSPMKNPTFLMFSFCAMLSSIGSNIPHIYLPEIEKDAVAAADGESSASTVLGIISATNIASRILLGYLSDQGCVNRLYLYNIILIIAGLGTLASPHLTGVWWVRAYAAFYGICTGSYKSMKPVILVDIVGLHKLNNAYGIFMLLETVGYFIGPPIVGKLYDTYGTYKEGFYFTGLTFIASGSLLFGVAILKKCVCSKN